MTRMMLGVKDENGPMPRKWYRTFSRQLKEKAELSIITKVKHYAILANETDTTTERNRNRDGIADIHTDAGRR